MPRTYLPTADSALLHWAQNFSALLTENFAAYSLPQTVATTYQNKLAAYQAALQIAKADATRGKSTVYAKDLAKKALISYTRDVAGQVGRTMTVTNQQREDLGLTVRKKPTPIPAPTTRPSITITSAVQRTIAIRVFDASTQFKRTKAPGSIGAKIYTFVGDTYPSDPTTWAYQGDATNGKMDIVLPDSVPGGAQVWITAAWFNLRGTGPVCVPVNTNIQGGGTQPVQGSLKIAA